MKRFAFAAVLALLAAAPAHAAAPRCAAAVYPAGYPQYAGTYELAIDGIYAQEATLVFHAAYPQYAGVTEGIYQLHCASLQGWPSYAVCTEEGSEAFKYGVSYSGEATLRVAGPNGQALELGALVCH